MDNCIINIFYTEELFPIQFRAKSNVLYSLALSFIFKRKKNDTFKRVCYQQWRLLVEKLRISWNFLVYGYKSQEPVSISI